MITNCLSLIALLSIVLLSTVHAVGQQPAAAATPPSYWSVEEQAKGLGVDLAKEFPEKYVTLVYFHRVPSCDHCQSMAKSVYFVMKEYFADAVKARAVNLKFVNFEVKENQPVIEMLGIKKPTIVLFETSPEGLRIQKATRMWDLAGDEAEFRKYIRTELEGFIK